MKTKQIFMAFAILTVFGSLTSVYGFPFFIVQKSGNNLAIVGESSYSSQIVGGPYTSRSEARAALQNLRQQVSSSPSAAFRQQAESVATNYAQRNRLQSAEIPEGPISLSSLRTKSTANTPLATLPLGDFSRLLSQVQAEQEFAAGLYASVPPYPELSIFQLSQPALGPSPLTPLPLSSSTISSIPVLPQPGFTLPQMTVPLTVPGVPTPIFTSPLPLAIGWR